ncbi:MAG: catecholate siderophore receptor CirA [Nitrosomonas sp.]|nr:MAG: catecholate siderophore receptor CirA [Nitrosomonas sp.]
MKILQLIVVIIAIFQHAQAVADDEFILSDSGLEDELLFQDIPSVYGASKYEQKVTKAPASVSIVTADEIQKYGYRTFAEILSSLKGFYTTNDRNYGFAGVRGFGLPSDYNTRLLLLIDGHRFNDNIYDAFDITAGFPVDIDIIERVEVVRGPASSIYGTNAFFGVINVITRRGRDQGGANVTASYGSFDTYKTRVSYGDRYDNGLEMFLSGTFYDSHGNRRLYYREFDDPATNNGIASNNDEERARNLMGTISFGNFTLQALHNKRNKHIPTASFGTVFNQKPSKTADQSTYVELKYANTFSNQLNLESRVSYNHYRYDGRYNFDYSEDEEPFIVTNKDFSLGQWWRGEVQATKLLWNDHKVTAGGEFQHNFDQRQKNYDLEVYTDIDKKTSRWGIFIQDEYSFNDKLTINAGVRLDYFNTFGETVNPRGGIIYNPWSDTAIKLLYGTAFRAPTQFEMFYHDGGITTLPNPNLTPEKLQTAELILEKYFTSRVRGELNFFYSEIKDLISITSTTDGLLQNNNIGEAESIGAEVQLEANYTNGFQGRISYSVQETTNKMTNERLTNSPAHMIKLNLIAPLWADKIFAGLETQYMSSRKSPVGGKVSDHVITNLTLFNQNWINGLELSAGLYNLFDESFFHPGSEEHTQVGILQNGRTFRIRASIDF